MMPYMNGLAVLRQLRESLASNDYLPIVVLTDMTFPDEALRSHGSASADW